MEEDARGTCCMDKRSDRLWLPHLCNLVKSYIITLTLMVKGLPVPGLENVMAGIIWRDFEKIIAQWSIRY